LAIGKRNPYIVSKDDCWIASNADEIYIGELSGKGHYFRVGRQLVKLIKKKKNNVLVGLVKLNSQTCRSMSAEKE